MMHYHSGHLLTGGEHEGKVMLFQARFPSPDAARAALDDISLPVVWVEDDDDDCIFIGSEEWPDGPPFVFLSQ